MALVNHSKREINAKIVFCGPESAGKATLLKAIYSLLPENNRGQLRSMSFQQDRMLFFDFTHPDGSDPEKYSLRLHVYTLTGQVTQENAWKMVLKGVDGVVFVSDSDPLRQTQNHQTFEGVLAAIHANGKRLNELPAVAVSTKQDLQYPVAYDSCNYGLPPDLQLFPVGLTSGKAVLIPFVELLRGILSNLDELGLSLQPAVMELCSLAPAPVEPVSVPMQTAQVDSGSQVCNGTELTDTHPPLITLDGISELDADGALTVGINVNCCGRISKSFLKISITDGR